jgi:hypothetical protein
LRLGIALTALVLLLGLSPARAERWQLQPAASLDTGYDDNVRLTPVDSEGAFSAKLNGALRAIRSTEISDIRFELGLAGTRYSGISDLDNTSGFAGLDLGYRLERSRFRLGTRFDSLSTLYSEQATTGLIQENRQQNRFSVTPGWTYLLSERATLDLAANYAEVSYEDVGLEPLFDYRVGSIDLGGSYGLTERFGLTGRLSYGRYETRGITNEYDNLGLQVGAEYQISEKASVAALVGFRQTEQTLEVLDGLTQSNTSSGPTYALSYTRRLERGGAFDLEARRELLPSGNSEVLDTTGLSAGLTYPLVPRWLLGLDASAYRNRSPGGERRDNDRRFVSVAPRLSFEIDESWRVSLVYRFRWQERDDDLGDAVSNAIFLTLNWTRPWDL